MAIGKRFTIVTFENYTNSTPKVIILTYYEKDKLIKYGEKWKNINHDFKHLDNGCQIVIGCPGRVFDMLKRFALKTDNLKLMIVDEADEMLSRGFKDQIYEILQYIPKECKVALFLPSWQRYQLAGSTR
mgnify:CR=1 FL=1